MESLIIENFLIIKYAEIEIKKINVIIGEQSTGKSIIAKLVFLFETFLFLKIKTYAFNDKDQKAIRRMVLQDFEQLFPRYAWKDQSFKISYAFKNTTFIIERHKESSDGYYKLTFTYSENFKQLYNRIIRQIRRLDRDDSLKPQEINSKAIEYITNTLSSSDLFKDREGFIPAEIFFIPASRTLFVKYFTNNIFTFLANNFDLDPLIINFGSNYEKAQRLYRIINESESLFKDKEDDKKLYDQIKLISEKILSGSYAREKDQDWLYHADGRKINLIDASSGQQEALPMLLILLVFSFFPDSESNQFFIEEPETHLFPSAQRDMVELFTLLYANKNCRFFLTTHSPYILTALNNKIMAANVKPAKAEKSLGYKNTIQFQDVSAYTISNGQTQSILDTEVNLIGINNLDAVSDELSQEFEEILERKAQQ
ncbi:MAG: ATP-binding protein [Microcystis aeruginosa W13-15]|jgi:AAA15 family ATPase/GTPase|nr:ATP-binding protein [Microcystis aeruginosa W13-16]NCQ74958.1 ATP-binding protein [Microcystis aeruginosa W13-13]NCQ79409.1 ATP-binding protein [Microcystis aeruginosa W13-15]NCS55093.1 ATP-binding protein [Microcystis aeruginosa G13-05]